MTDGFPYCKSMPEQFGLLKQPRHNTLGNPIVSFSPPSIENLKRCNNIDVNQSNTRSSWNPRKNQYCIRYKNRSQSHDHKYAGLNTIDTGFPSENVFVNHILRIYSLPESSNTLNKSSWQEYFLIKRLNFILRHGAPYFGLYIRNDAFVRVSELLQLPCMQNVTWKDIQSAVDGNHKQRYELRYEDDGEEELNTNAVRKGLENIKQENSQDLSKWFLRATQGHTIRSIRNDLLLHRIENASQLEICIHGTYLNNWLAIRSLGIHRMHRNHIHFATGLPSDAQVVSGMRRSSEVAIYINVEKAMSDNISFFISMNGVILTEGKDGVISPEYFLKVYHLKTQYILYDQGIDHTEEFIKHYTPNLSNLDAKQIFEHQLQHDIDTIVHSPYATPELESLINGNYGQKPNQIP